jgi:hypothetical protein
LLAMSDRTDEFHKLCDDQPTWCFQTCFFFSISATCKWRSSLYFFFML